MTSAEGGLIMLASRTGRLFLGLLFVCFFLLSSSYCIAANRVKNGERLQPIPSAPSEDDDYSGPDAESSYDAGEPCYDDECSFCEVPLCSPPGRFWIRADWLMWWTSPVHLPPLVTTSPQGTLQEEAGVLGFPNTEVLFGDSFINDGGRSGVRITVGGWLDRCHTWGLEGDWLTLGGVSTNYSNQSFGDPILARPFFDVESGAQNSEITAYQDVATGSVDINGNSYFDSVGMAMRYNLCCNSCGDPCGDECIDPCTLYYCRTDLLVGFRRYTLNDNLTINEDVLHSDIDAREQITDSFVARNEFYGSEVGLSTELRRGRWSLNLLGKMAMGNNHQTVIIDGWTTVTQEGQVDVRSGGILAVRSNMGTYTKDEFVIIPQFGAEIGYQLTCRWRTFVGYNILYWAPVMRAADQIDLNIDPRNWPIPEDPALPFPAYPGRLTNFWAMGINVGTELRF